MKVKFLFPDKVRAPVVRMIFEDYVVHGLERYPPPESPDPARRTGRWGHSSVWEILHNPKFTGYQVWNRRQRKRGGKTNPPEKWIWSDEPAHEALVSRETFEKAALIGIRNDNSSKRTESHEEFRKNVYPLRSFLHCSICGLRMHARSRRTTHAYVCSTSSRQPGLVPAGHPKFVYLNEAKAGKKIIEFLSGEVFGPERVRLLREALLATDPERDEADEEVERLTKELYELRNRTKRLMANFETEEPGSELLKDLKQRLTELAEMRAKKERELESSQRVVHERPDAETAEETISSLPLIDVDWDLLLEEDFRDLLQTLNFEARYDARTNELAVQVVLIPELLFPDEPVNSSVLWSTTSVRAPGESRTEGTNPIACQVDLPNLSRAALCRLARTCCASAALRLP